MKSIRFLLLSLSFLTIANQNCLTHRKRLGQGPVIPVQNCRCNCDAYLAHIKSNNPQRRGQCPVCRHFHVPSKIKFRKV